MHSHVGQDITFFRPETAASKDRKFKAMFAVSLGCFYFLVDEIGQLFIRLQDMVGQPVTDKIDKVYTNNFPGFKAAFVIQKLCSRDHRASPDGLSVRGN